MGDKENEEERSTLVEIEYQEMEGVRAGGGEGNRKEESEMAMMLEEEEEEDRKEKETRLISEKEGEMKDCLTLFVFYGSPPLSHSLPFTFSC